jgi:hypothetical protein
LWILLYSLKMKFNPKIFVILYAPIILGVSGLVASPQVNAAAPTAPTPPTPTVTTEVTAEGAPTEAAPVVTVLPPRTLRSVEKLSADLADGRDILVFWEPALDPRVEGYKVYRGNSAETLVFLTDVSLEERSYLDVGLELDIDYFYRVDTVAAGFDPTPSEVRQIKISETIAESGQEGESPASAPADDNSRFFVSLLSLNMLAIGLLALGYILVRRALIARQYKDYTPGPKLNAKTGNPDVDIIEEVARRQEKN